MHPIYRFDRIRIHTDAVISSDLLLGFCVVGDQTPFNRNRRCCIEIMQPSLEQLKALAQELELHQVDISYAEISADLPMSGDAAQDLLDASLGCLKFAFLPAALCRHKTTLYVGNRSNRVSVAMYADRPSKFDSQEARARDKAFHIEYRVTGAHALASIGLSTLREAIDFNHQEFHDRRTRVLKVPETGKLGHFLVSSKDDASLQLPALRKRARVWRASHGINGHFCLHNAIRETPNLARNLVSEKSFCQWFAELGDG